MSLYDEIANKIIKQLEENKIPWQQPWKNGVYAWSRGTGKPYSILNALLLEPGEYATMNQIKKEGGQVYKGAKAYKVVFYKPMVMEEEKDGVKKKKVIPYLRYSNVFNVAMQTTLEPKHFQDQAECEPIERAEEVAKNYISREKIRFFNNINSSKAYYDSKEDTIVVPNMGQFATAESYYNTLFHEMAHSTGHKTRLDRVLKGFMNDKESYSKEELIAEITASTLCSAVNIVTDNTNQDNISYIQGWLEALKNDKMMIVQAAAKSSKAFEYIMKTA